MGTDCRTRSHNTKALTEVSMKMLLGTLFLCWTAPKHTKTCPLKTQLWKHPTTAASTGPQHFVQGVPVPSSHKNPSKLKHSGTNQTLIHTPEKHLGNYLLAGTTDTSDPFNEYWIWQLYHGRWPLQGKASFKIHKWELFFHASAFTE